jgi:hypothetical protein
MSYGQNDPLNTGFWVSPYTYKALFDKFKLTTTTKLQTELQPDAALSLAQRAKPVEKLVAMGQINADGTVDLQPFFRAKTAASSGEGKDGEFSLELLGDKNEVLVEHRFDGQAMSHSEEGATGFTEFVPWQAGTSALCSNATGWRWPSVWSARTPHRCTCCHPTAASLWKSKRPLPGKGAIPTATR